MSWKPPFDPKMSTRVTVASLLESYDSLFTTESIILSKTVIKHYLESCIEFSWETLKEGLTDSPGC